jgi:hypothetical protein
MSSFFSRPKLPLSWPSCTYLSLFVATSLFLGGCASMSTSSGPYHVDAYAPVQPKNVKVFVSLKAEIVYVMEGDTCLLATPVTVGTPQNPTPTGSFKVTDKNPTKRSGEYGFWVNGSSAVSGDAGKPPGPGYSYVGYPMANWVGFAPGFGFHEGYVWPIPHSHGCLRINKNASAKFFQLVQVGTPVIIAQTQPEDATIGKTVVHPTDYKDPDPPAAELISPAYFTEPRDNQLLPPVGSTAAGPAPASAAMAAPAAQ